MTDSHTPSTDDTADGDEYTLIHPSPAMVKLYLERLEELGFEIETAAIKQPSEQSPGTLSIKFWNGGHPADEQEDDR